MITNWFVLQKLSHHLNEQYSNAVLERCFTFEKNELWLEFRDRAPLKVHLGQPFQYAILGSEGQKVTRESVRIFPSLDGAIVKDVAMLPAERIMKIAFRNASALYILFLSNRGNVIYQKDDELEYFKKKVTVDPQMLVEKQAQSFSSIEEDPRFSPYWKRNAFDIFNVNEYSELIKIMEKSNGNEINERFVLTKTENSYDPALFYANYRQFVVTHLQEDHFHSDFKQLESRITAKMDDLQKKIRHTQDDGKIEKRVERYQYFASVLSASRHLIEGHQDSFEVPDMYRTEGFPTEIPLKKDISLSENIDLYYKKARSAKNSIEENRNRHQSLLKEFPIWEETLQRTARDQRFKNFTRLEAKRIILSDILKSLTSPKNLEAGNDSRKTSIQGIYSRWLENLGW